MAIAHKLHWNRRYTEEYHGRRPPRSWLVDNSDIVQMRAQLARSQGGMPTGLDLACGPGRNVIFLAEEGWHVTGVDISEKAIGLAQEQADQAGLSARTDFIVADLDQWRPAAQAYDLITCFFFLDRSLWPAIRAALRPDGLLIMETFNTHRRDGFPSDFLLTPGELYAEVRSWGWEILASRAGGPDLPRPTDAIVAVKPAWLIS